VWPDSWEVRCYGFTEEIKFDEIGNVKNWGECTKPWFREFSTKILKAELQNSDPHPSVPERVWGFARQCIRELGYRRYAFIGEGPIEEADRFGHAEL